MPKESYSKSAMRERDKAVKRLQNAGKAYKKLGEKAAKSKKAEDKQKYEEERKNEVKKVATDVPLLVYYYPKYDYPGYSEKGDDPITVILDAYNQYILGFIPQEARNNYEISNISEMQKDRKPVLDRVRAGGKALISLNEKLSMDLLASVKEKDRQRRNLIDAYEADIKQLLIFYPNREYPSRDSFGITVLLDAYEKLKDKKQENDNETDEESILEGISSRAVAKDGQKDSRDQLQKIAQEGGSITDGQKKGLRDIAKWMYRNSDDTGALSLDPSQERFVRVILNLPARMKLFMYYLIENDKLQEASVGDVIASQMDYIPNLEAFKDKMISSKWKFWQRILGGYVAWNKLEEAMKNAQQRANIIALFGNADYLDVTTGGTSGKSSGAASSKGAENNTSDQDQMIRLLKEMIGSISQHRDLLAKRDSGQNVDESALKQTKQNILDKYDKLLKLDVATGAETNFKSSTIEDAENYIDKASLVGMGDKLSMVGTAANFVKWHIADLHLTNLNLSAGIFNSVGGVCALAGTLAKMIDIIQSAEETSGQEITGEVLELIGSFAGVASTLTQSAYTIKNMKYVGAAAESTAGIAASKLAAKATGAASIVTGSIDVIAGMHQYGKAVSSAAAAKEARADMKNLTEEESDTADQILALNTRINDTRATTGALKAVSGKLQMIGGILSVAGVTSAIGTILSTMGTAASLAATVWEFYQRSKNRKETIDLYINMDKIEAFVVSKLRQNEIYKTFVPENLREQIRGEIVACLGYASEDSFYRHITRVYARFLLQKACYSADGKLLEGAARHNPYVEMIKSFGFSVVFPAKEGETPKPDVDTLAKKMII